MIVLGIESSCDETGVALVDPALGVLAQALHSQVAMHRDYGGVVPELASRDHVRRVLPLTRRVLAEANVTLRDVDLIAYTAGPGLPGALLVGASVALGLGAALDRDVYPVHHLEGHLVSPLLAQPRPDFPFVALLISGGHTQLMRVDGLGDYALLGETADDAAGEAFDKTANLLGLGYPGGPALEQLARQGDPTRYKLPRPMLASGDLNMSFSGLKTAVATLLRSEARARAADAAAAFQEAAVDVLTQKSIAALKQTRLRRLVVAGGVGANTHLRARLTARAAALDCEVFFPPFALCTDNGAMIALAAALRAQAAGDVSRLEGTIRDGRIVTRPRWPLHALSLAPVA